LTLIDIDIEKGVVTSREPF